MALYGIFEIKMSSPFRHPHSISGSVFHKRPNLTADLHAVPEFFLIPQQGPPRIPFPAFEGHEFTDASGLLGFSPGTLAAFAPSFCGLPCWAW